MWQRRGKLNGTSTSRGFPGQGSVPRASLPNADEQNWPQTGGEAGRSRRGHARYTCDIPETSLLPITLLLAVTVAIVLLVALLLRKPGAALAVLPSRSRRRCALKAAFCRILD